jgi:hypothetical protein
VRREVFASVAASFSWASCLSRCLCRWCCRCRHSEERSDEESQPVEFSEVTTNSRGTVRTTPHRLRSFAAPRLTSTPNATATGPAKAGRYSRKYLMTHDASPGETSCVEARRWQSHRTPKVLGGSVGAGQREALHTFAKLPNRILPPAVAESLARRLKSKYEIERPHRSLFRGGHPGCGGRRCEFRAETLRFRLCLRPFRRYLAVDGYAEIAGRGSIAHIRRAGCRRTVEPGAVRFAGRADAQAVAALNFKQTPSSKPKSKTERSQNKK